MKVFISWSGDVSKAVAVCLHKFINRVTNANCFVSAVDIQVGANWPERLSKELSSMNFGIICLTKENMEKPWLMFEAGAIAKDPLNRRLVPLVIDFDLERLPAPLSHFQGKGVQRDDLLALVHEIDAQCIIPLGEVEVIERFEANFATVSQVLNDLPNSSEEQPPLPDERLLISELANEIRSLSKGFSGLEATVASLFVEISGSKRNFTERQAGLFSGSNVFIDDVDRIGKMGPGLLNSGLFSGAIVDPISKLNKSTNDEFYGLIGHARQEEFALAFSAFKHNPFLGVALARISVALDESGVLRKYPDLIHDLSMVDVFRQEEPDDFDENGKQAHKLLMSNVDLMKILKGNWINSYK